MENNLKIAILEYITGTRKELEITSSPRAAAALYEAIDSSKNLHEKLIKESNFDEIKIAMERRKEAIVRFKSVTGEDWDF